MTATMRMTATAIVLWLAGPANAAREGGIADPSRGTVTITAMAAAQARLGGDGGAACLWSNTATGLIDIVTTDTAGTMRHAAPDAVLVAAPTPACTAGDALRTRRIVMTAAQRGAVAILVSPE